MVQGCTSDAGKSLLTAALCRYFSNNDVRVAPFKAQNMSNNAAVCADGGEIGRAQHLQALAARVEPDVRMNPILLKPMADTSSRVIMLGRPAPELSTLGWGERRSTIWPVVVDALQSLRSEYDLVIAEGAGSPAEINLRESDIVNMSIALETNALVYLVADIDRGGAFAHLLGTVECLSTDERALVRGFVLNKFRGDASLLAPAPEWLESKTSIATVAVVPWIHHRIPDEDRLLLHSLPGTDEPGSDMSSPHVAKPRVAVIAYPWASNFDEFEGLAAQPEIDVEILRARSDLRDFAGIILPGSRNTVASLEWLRAEGLAAAISSAARSGTAILGICGGMQMLGREISDPHQLESGGIVDGLGLLDISTEMAEQKVTRRVITLIARTGERVEGYEIHHGVTTPGPGAIDELTNGLGWRQGNVTGIYVHGLLDDRAYRRHALTRFGVAVVSEIDQAASLDAEFDALAISVAATGWYAQIEADLHGLR